MLKIPPHSIEAEQSVLWSILIDKDCFITIWEMLNPEDFYSDANLAIYEVMHWLYKLNKPIDLITVMIVKFLKKLVELFIYQN